MARERWERAADWLAVALAVVLPWSTSLSGICAALWLTCIVPTIDGARLRAVVSTPAGGFPVLLWLLAFVGMLWAAGVPVSERLNGLSSFHKLLFIPLLMMQFERAGRASNVLYGYLSSCAALLLLAALTRVPHWPWQGHSGPGIPVKDYITQDGEFVVCAFLLAPIALRAWQEQRRRFAVALVLLCLAFIGGITLGTISRTALVILPVLLALFVLRFWSLKRALLLLVAAIIAGALTVAFVPVIHATVTQVLNEVRTFKPDAVNTRAGERLEYWKKSVRFISAAPLVGHGTGSIRDQFRKSVTGKTGMAAMASSNPHNQVFAVGIQLGALGILMLLAFWASHLLLFRGVGFAAWAGLMIVAQNIVGSLFNSHLFDFTQGWGYVIGVGITGGLALRQARREPGR